MLAALGLIDDLRDLPARVRLPIQGIAVAGSARERSLFAIPLVVAPISIHPAWLVYGLDFLIVLWMVNLYNFMDGIDGIAATQCVGLLRGGAVDRPPRRVHGGIPLGFARAPPPGFWCSITPPARIFMGDVGSGLLGLLIAIASLTLDARGQMPLIASLILLAGFWFDATYTLCVRIASGQKFASAHRSHLYQKCARRFGHGRTTTMFGGYAYSSGYFRWRGCCVQRARWGLVLLVVAVMPLLHRERTDACRNT